ncbi:cyclo(L-tyrosyl-L-tyrosyl) synthase [Longimycelium tulufanense]|uniref:Cyclodipeptide synthase n=1 Tax=Longimycelium tulufanense TaxID=907463 RepID=A0A8J3FV63_9PSEU|nr:tRNA-dependent cyclodipeptide synthase [Longimycelium tulufanense]GGM60882.1 cyclo(L-tyrosyl-L-tyrosyl) synthase [Longimycelium tulufanense]
MTTAAVSTSTPTEIITREGFRIRPYTPHCHVIYADRDHAVIGVSPGNSYFSARRIHDLARWGLAHFDRVDFIYTDVRVADMYQALGYTEIDARRKAAKNLRGVRAKVTRTVVEVDPRRRRVFAHPISAFESNQAYLALRGDLIRRLEVDEKFRVVCETLVERFLSTKLLEGKAPTTHQKRVCLDYICAEAPLFLDTPAILGVPSSLNCYHQLLPMAELLYARGSGLRASRNQGHAIVTPIGDNA